MQFSLPSKFYGKNMQFAVVTIAPLPFFINTSPVVCILGVPPKANEDISPRRNLKST
jgi:hypothetical protein